MMRTPIKKAIMVENLSMVDIIEDIGGEMYDPLREYALEQLKSEGLIDDAWDAVDLFERTMAEYAGSNFAVAVDNCTDALYLCLKYLNCDKNQDVITIPKRTYASIPMVIHNAGCKYKFDDISWSGAYQLDPYPIYDSALRLTRGMYIQDSFQCISFHRKKILKLTKGGIILTNREDLIKKINSAVFPGYQGGPLMHVIAAKAAGFLEALQPEFKEYIKSVLANAKILAETLKNNGFKIYSDGTDTHLMLVDLRPYKVKGNLAAESLSRANITCNKNGIPFDTEKPMITSGIRLGTQAITTRGFGLNECQKVGELITKVIKGLSENPDDNSKIESDVRNEVISLTSSFPIYKNL